MPSEQQLFSENNDDFKNEKQQEQSIFGCVEIRITLYISCYQGVNINKNGKKSYGKQNYVDKNSCIL